MPTSGHPGAVGRGCGGCGVVVRLSIASSGVNGLLENRNSGVICSGDGVK